MIHFASNFLSAALVAVLPTFTQPADAGTVAPAAPPAAVAMLGVSTDALADALVGSCAVSFSGTTEQCGGQLYVETGHGCRLPIQRGCWVMIDNGCRGDLIWYCGASREISRGVQGHFVQVYHSTHGRQITIRW